VGLDGEAWRWWEREGDGVEGEGGGAEGLTIIKQHSIFPIHSRPTTTTYDSCCLYNTRRYLFVS